MRSDGWSTEAPDVLLLVVDYLGPTVLLLIEWCEELKWIRHPSEDEGSASQIKAPARSE